ncbi:hypothetical protein E2562_014680 [Oryza meyeriana var. granulata]|uniref:Uncharacterized protein n=1 Tax=Oryza meyeriana var. granulata TaxID=110450 RepID=A0A6G1D3X4_9ORYZ|nr:hypothetical protein E2562_014680 [Oryza meyeriana var. granulata]
MLGLLEYSAGCLGLLALAALESLPLRLSTPLHLRHLLAAVVSALVVILSSDSTCTGGTGIRSRGVQQDEELSK